MHRLWFSMNGIPQDVTELILRDLDELNRCFELPCLPEHAPELLMSETSQKIGAPQRRKDGDWSMYWPADRAESVFEEIVSRHWKGEIERPMKYWHVSETKEEHLRRCRESSSGLFRTSK